jgi:hypothetical protein
MTTIGVGIGLLLAASGVLYGISYCCVLLGECVHGYYLRRVEMARRRAHQPYLPADPRAPRRPPRLPEVMPSPAHPAVRAETERQQWATEQAHAAHRALRKRDELIWQALLEQRSPGGRHRRLPDTGRHHLSGPVPDSGRPPRHAKPDPADAPTEVIYPDFHWPEPERQEACA